MKKNAKPQLLWRLYVLLCLALLLAGAALNLPTKLCNNASGTDHLDCHTYLPSSLFAARFLDAAFSNPQPSARQCSFPRFLNSVLPHSGQSSAVGSSHVMNLHSGYDEQP